ncbi:replication initiation protein [Aliarcobacter butzleri]|uniref:replication initiation protein n=1 Tax=Aliarcobacter butzleri TaxID=28197 RepID=UPI001260B2BC|nr:replication initiation protein [Aliarcobacter butzleri]
MEKEVDYKVSKHNSLVNAKSKYQYSVNQLKLICHLIANIKPTDTNLEMKQIAIKDLGFVEENTYNHYYFKEEFVKLLEMPFQIPGTKKWVNWFSCLEYDTGVLNYAFDERLKPFLLQLKGNFTEYYLSNVMNLKSNYAILTFELLSQSRDIGYRNITIKEYRELLKIPDSYLNADVLRLLKKVQKEIRERTNLQFNFAMKKMGKPFHSINFVLLNNKKVAGVTYELVTKSER